MQVGTGGVMRGLTFDMRGGRQLAKPDVGRPLDGRVRPVVEDHTSWPCAQRLGSLAARSVARVHVRSSARDTEKCGNPKLPLLGRTRMHGAFRGLWCLTILAVTQENAPRISSA